VTDATLGVESTAASPAAAPLPTPLLRERNLAVQFVAVVMAAASTVAIALVGTLSIGCHAAVMLVAKIGPLRTLYEALSGAYDRLLDQLAQKVLRDPRDTPALRLMIAITFSVLPIFLVQLVLKKPSLLLVAVFLPFALRHQVSALRQDIQRQTPRSSPPPRLFLGHLR